MADNNNFVSCVCAACRQEFEVPRARIGQAVECPACGAHLVVAPHEPDGASTPAQADAMKSRTIRIELGDL
ncbi:MAG: hypothetical protein ACI4RA_05790 [Kiritimatiellia bacterium]